VAEWFFLPCWKPSARPRVRPTGDEGGAWLVFADAYGVGSDLAERLRARGERVVTVTAAGDRRGDGRDSVIDGHDFTINPRRGEDYEELVRELAEGGRLPERVVHLWSLTVDEGDAPSASRFEEFQRSGYYSVMRLLQALWRQGAGGPVRVELVANHLYEVDGGDELVPEKATLGGPALVAPQEHPGVVCRCTDTDIPPDDTSRREALVAQLMGEVCGESVDPAVAYRRGRRWVQAYEPVRLEAADGERLPLRSRGVYLITGGLGGVGMVLARHFAQTTQARLILVGRSAFPGREDWPRWLAGHEPDDRTSRKIRQLQALEELGSEVLVLRADVSQREELGRALAAGEERFGALDGVVHAAGHVGVETFREISQATTADSEAQFSAKVHGLLNLADALADRPLDFCLLTSSLSSILGGLGFAAYSAANLFMDAFARRKNRAGGVAWTSVNWDSWRLPDMRPAIAGLGASVSEFVMEPEEAAEACDRILAEGNLTQVVVSSGDLHARLRQWVGRDPQSTPAPAAVTPHGRPNLSTPYAAPRGELERELAEIWQELFGVEQVGIHDNFFELGGHSLLATQLSARLYSKLQVEMSLATLLQAPTVAELAVAVVNTQMERADPAALESVLAEIGQLSESELRRLLAEQDQP
jgi:NAD(P)-dependent dehydrogenase (short-subunit alcohol dehydrogenase family)/acyl carrier protein